MAEQSIGLISGTGPQGRGLALRFASSGVEVLLGSRQETRAVEVAGELNALLETQLGQGCFRPIIGQDNPQAISAARLVLLTVPFEHAASTLHSYRDAFFSHSIFVDVTVPLRFSGGDVQVVVPAAGSGSRHLRAILPAQVPFTGAFKTLPAQVLEDIATPMNCDTFVFGDQKQAKAELIKTIARIPHLRPLDVGGLSAAATLEGMTALVIRINRKQKSKAGRYQVVGSA